MEPSKKRDKNPFRSIIAEGDVFKGEFDLVGGVRVDGVLKGSLTTESEIRITKHGKGDGFIRAKKIFIGGEFIGDLEAEERIEILSTAYVKGNITAGYLIIEEGAFFSGDCHITTKIIKFPPKKDEDSKYGLLENQKKKKEKKLVKI